MGFHPVGDLSCARWLLLHSSARTDEPFSDELNDAFPLPIFWNIILQETQMVPKVSRGPGQEGSCHGPHGPSLTALHPGRKARVQPGAAGTSFPDQCRQPLLIDASSLSLPAWMPLNPSQPFSGQLLHKNKSTCHS